MQFVNLVNYFLKKIRLKGLSTDEFGVYDI